MQLQADHQQLQAVAMQKQSLAVQKMEVERALASLEKTGAKEDVYSITGPLLIRTTRESASAELKEKKEKLEASLKRMEDHEKKILEKAREGQSKIEALFSKPAPKAKAG